MGETPLRFIPKGYSRCVNHRQPHTPLGLYYFSSILAHWNTPPARFEPTTFWSWALHSTRLPLGGIWFEHTSFGLANQNILTQPCPTNFSFALKLHHLIRWISLFGLNFHHWFKLTSFSLLNWVIWIQLASFVLNLDIFEDFGPPYYIWRRKHAKLELDT